MASAAQTIGREDPETRSKKAQGTKLLDTKSTFEPNYFTTLV
jgi:hypothetical protein